MLMALLSPMSLWDSLKVSSSAKSVAVPHESLSLSGTLVFLSARYVYTP